MKIFKKFTPGSNIVDVLEDVRRYNNDGIACSISYLPVLKNSPWRVDQEVNVYFEILEKINEQGANCDVTIKLHQLGVYGRSGLVEESVARIVDYAKSLNNFVWVDMERSDTVDATIELCRELYQRYPGSFGICLQAYLKRTERDMKLLLSMGMPMRFVKGFYKDHDFNSWDEVSQNYRHLMTYVLDHSSRPAIAGHDLEIHKEVKRYVIENGLKEKMEFQFFKGVRDDLARQLVHEGFHVRIYVPFGSVWRFIIHGFRTFDLMHQIERMAGFKPW